MGRKANTWRSLLAYLISGANFPGFPLSCALRFRLLRCLMAQLSFMEQRHIGPLSSEQIQVAHRLMSVSTPVTRNASQRNIAHMKHAFAQDALLSVSPGNRRCVATLPSPDFFTFLNIPEPYETLTQDEPPRHKTKRKSPPGIMGTSAPYQPPLSPEDRT